MDVSTIFGNKLAIFTKIIIFCAKMSRYFHFTYCLQEEPTHFGLRLSTYFNLEVSTQFGPKKFELCQFFIQNFQCQNLPQFQCYIQFTYYPNFILLFINQKWFSFFFLHTPIPSSCWIPCYRH